MTSFLFLFLFLFTCTVSGFQSQNPKHASTLRTGPLYVGTAIETEGDARLILLRAKHCAYGDSCSVEDCAILLREMVHLQSGCVTGTLVGHDLCEDQDIAADVVAHLREKVKDHDVMTSKDSTFIVPWIATKLSVGALMLVVAIFWTVNFLSLDMEQRQGTTPFTMQEWWWSVRDGYLGSAVEHHIQNGAL